MKNYETTTRIITILNYMVALRNFIDPRKHRLKFICSWIWNTFLIFVLSVFAIHAEIQNTEYHMAHNIESVTYMFQYTTHVLGYTSIMVIGLYQSKNVLAMMNQIDKVDVRLKKLGVEIEYRSLLRHITIVGSFWLLNAVVTSAIFIKILIQNLLPPLIAYLIFIECYISSAQSIVLYDYNTAIYWLGSRFKMINDLLETFLLEKRKVKTQESNTETIFEPSHNFRNRFESNDWLSERSLNDSGVFTSGSVSNVKQKIVQEKVHILRQIRFVHLQVCKVSRMVNDIFNAQILIYTITTLLYCTICVYALYMDLQRGFNIVVDRLDFVSLYMLDSVVSTLKIALMSYDCEYTMRQASKTIGNIHAYPVHEGNAELTDEILNFSWQISYTQLEKTKSVHYILNYGFVRYCLNFVISYLVIMVQWSQNLIKNGPILITNETTTLYENTSVVV
ncbi:uncharacterized protein LOC132905908 isoform X1 [Bombus pascuorum]|uniref:uncharacterized protein LOC132905908 isoform X1 n=1 Tax=Bombus pascuorum TaxID=65598 RepID=UPI00298EAAD5|nr:uncharacterized protein LOC132905908 isoform X1 [Bombus pascuorum]